MRSMHLRYFHYEKVDLGIFEVKLQPPFTFGAYLLLIKDNRLQFHPRNYHYFNGRSSSAGKLIDFLLCYLYEAYIHR